jgi:hypothetical protein
MTTDIKLTTEAMVKKEQLREDMETFQKNLEVSKYDDAVKLQKELVKGGVPATELNLSVDLTPAITNGFKSFPEIAQQSFVLDQLDFLQAA